MRERKREMLTDRQRKRELEQKQLQGADKLCLGDGKMEKEGNRRVA